MAKAELERTLDVPIDALWRAVTGYADYSKFVEGVTQSQLRDASAHPKVVDYAVTLMKEVQYVLAHTEDASTHTMHWDLVESKFFKSNRGGWQLTDLGEGRTKVRYWIELEFGFFAPGFVVNQLIQSQLPKMVAQFEARAKALA